MGGHSIVNHSSVPSPSLVRLTVFCTNERFSAFQASEKGDLKSQPGEEEEASKKKNERAKSFHRVCS